MHSKIIKQNHKLSNSKVINTRLTRNAPNRQSFTAIFWEKSSSAMHKLSTGIRILFYLHKITACFRILLCSSTQIYYKMNCHNSAKIICTLYKIRAQQQWIEKQVFAISSHIYQTVSEDYLLLHKMSVPQSFAKHSYPSITRTSAKASATSHVKKLGTKKHMSIHCHNYYYNKSNSGHQTKNQHIKHQDNQNHKPLFKVFWIQINIYWVLHHCTSV